LGATETMAFFSGFGLILPGLDDGKIPQVYGDLCLQYGRLAEASTKEGGKGKSFKFLLERFS